MSLQQAVRKVELRAYPGMHQLPDAAMQASSILPGCKKISDNSWFCKACMFCIGCKDLSDNSLICKACMFSQDPLCCATYDVVLCSQSTHPITRLPKHEADVELILSQG